MKEKLEILVLSSRMPSHSANLGKDAITALTQAGHHVTFGFEGIDEYIADCTKSVKNSFFKKVYYKLHYYLRKYLRNWVGILPSIKSWTRNGTIILHTHEDKPAIPAELVAEKIKGPFDICIVIFWHGLFTTKTFKAIYEKFHCPIVFDSVDLMPITGGCYYFGECQNYKRECGNCHVLGGNNRNDQTHKNFLYKKAVYDSIECVFLGNSWMLNYAEQSHIFDNAKLRNISFILDEKVFAPRNRVECRKRLGVPENKKYVFLSRYRNVARKGMDILVKGINDLYDSLSQDDKDKTILLLVSGKVDGVESVFKMEVLQLGYVDYDGLIDAFNASTAFLCSSTEDAGPSMINQSMACGTPVIAFDAGTAIDVIEDGVNGYKVPLCEKERWGEGLLRICELSDEDYLEMRRKARETAEEKNSLGVFAKAIEDIYHEFRPNGKQ